MIDEVTIDGTDVTSYRITWDVEDEWNKAIPVAILTFTPTLLDILVPVSGMAVTIKRGFSAITEDFVFNGEITQYKPEANIVTLICKGRMIEAVKAIQTKSWDKDIDTQAGVGSEIFKDLCDHSGLSYDDTTIISTGTDEEYKLVKVIQNDEDDFDIMNMLANRYNYMISFDNSLNKVLFKPKGYTLYSAPLTVGTEIPGQIKWKENAEQLVNKVKIFGATVYDTFVETIAGPLTTFTLTKNPEETEVRVGGSGGTLQRRGVKNTGTIGTDFDYYVDAELKTVTFGSAQSNVYFKYGTQVPMPVILQNDTSINSYGGPNKTASYKRYSFTDIKDIKDAEDRGNAILAKYSTPFIEAESVPINNSTLQTNGFIKAGDLVTITDTYTKKSAVQVFVQIVKKTFPHVNDKLTIGDELWRTENWQVSQMQKINQLFNELNKNQQILVTALSFPVQTHYERRDLKVLYRDQSGIGTGSFILGHPTFGILGTSKLGDATYTTAYDTVGIVQYNNIYKEYIYDTDYYESGTDETWDTATQTISVLAGGDIGVGPIALGYAFNYVTISLGDTTGTYTIQISADGKNTWQTITEGLKTALTNSDTTGVHLLITATDAITIEPVIEIDGTYSEPAITITMED